MGAMALYSTIGKECDDCDTLDKMHKFGNSLESNQKVGYGFIFLGGILVAAGI